MKMWLVVMALVTVVLVACGGDGEDDEGEAPADAVVRLLEYVSDGQWGREWDELHPAHQAIVSRDAWVSCNSDLSVELEGVTVEEVFDEPVSAVDIPQGPAKAVTVSYRVNGREDTDTFQVLDVDGAWRWVLQDDVLAAYREGRCP